MTSWLLSTLGYVVPFMAVLTAVIFVHELGHYLVARWCRVRIETFSLGFGPELWGFTDRNDTRWRVSLFPLGGYVKMHGELAGELHSSGDSQDAPGSQAGAEPFADRPLGQRAAIISAGPGANFLFAVAILTFLFVVQGKPYTLPEVAAVHPDSAAERAGFQSGDLIVAIQDTSGGRAAIKTFEELQTRILRSPGQELTLTVHRNIDGREHQLELTAIPAAMTYGSQISGFLGLEPTQAVHYSRTILPEAAWLACAEAVRITKLTFQALVDIIWGVRSVKELGGPLRIAQLSGKVAQEGLMQLLWFTAILSVNLGFINLLPIPVLDGGHLTFQAVEAVRRRPLSPAVQQYGMMLGLVAILALMLLVTWNDALRLLG